VRPRGIVSQNNNLNIKFKYGKKERLTR
jgi:hypothetical protein